MHDDASMARCDKKAHRSELCLNIKIHINLAFTRSRKLKDVEIVGEEIEIELKCL